ncbi:UbiA prenyltransferase family protein [Ferruginibacter albus]|uniref:hypothetical protein n=1 Tax=Ferruginibacter albus TaxID=2875540 RepID=UPI001CC61D2A|nr:hypothetical protein [Ferruginibacter albus]UAY52901.1 hypothetical protein K9M53_04285 [Ferruginibacter albus]
MLFIFFATLSGYNAYWLLSKFSFNKTALWGFVKKEIIPVMIILLSIAGMFYCLLQLHLIWYNIAITFLLMVLYSIPLLPIRQIQFTRKAGAVKTILLSLTWAHVTTMIPLQKTIAHLSFAEIIIYLIHFLFVLLLCIIFDKRDVAMDKMKGLHSIATDISAKGLHYIVVVIFMLLSLLSVSLTQFGIAFHQSSGLLITAIITFMVYILSLKKRGYYFYYFLVDGLMLFSALITYLLSL